MNVQNMFPLLWYSHVAAETELRWMYEDGVAPALLYQVFHVRCTSGHNSRDLEAAVAQIGGVRLGPSCPHDGHWCGGMPAVNTSSVPTSVAVMLFGVHWFVADEARCTFVGAVMYHVCRVGSCRVRKHQPPGYRDKGGSDLQPHTLHCLVA